MEVMDESTPVEGRVERYERLFRTESPRLWRMLYAFTGGRAAIAEDAVAEAFARAMAAREPPRDPVRWIYRTAFRIAIDEIRAERRGRPSPREGDVAPGTDVELFDALRQLSPNQRAAVVMRYEADLSIDEIARRLGTSSPTVRVHLHRGRRRLRELLSDHEGGRDG
jgi:RNA polymerase sigma-70 factor (ECF subfamily)